LKAEW